MKTAFTELSVEAFGEATSTGVYFSLPCNMEVKNKPLSSMFCLLNDNYFHESFHGSGSPWKLWSMFCLLNDNYFHESFHGSGSPWKLSSMFCLLNDNYFHESFHGSGSPWKLSRKPLSFRRSYEGASTELEDKLPWK